MAGNAGMAHDNVVGHRQTARTRARYDTKIGPCPMIIKGRRCETNLLGGVFVARQKSCNGVNEIIGRSGNSPRIATQEEHGSTIPVPASSRHSSLIFRLDGWRFHSTLSRQRRRRPHGAGSVIDPSAWPALACPDNQLQETKPWVIALPCRRTHASQCPSW